MLGLCLLLWHFVGIGEACLDLLRYFFLRWLTVFLASYLAGAAVRCLQLLHASAQLRKDQLGVLLLLPLNCLSELLHLLLQLRNSPLKLASILLACFMLLLSGLGSALCHTRARYQLVQLQRFKLALYRVPERQRLLQKIECLVFADQPRRVALQRNHPLNCPPSVQSGLSNVLEDSDKFRDCVSQNICK